MKFNHKKFYKRVDKLVEETLGRPPMPLDLVPRQEWYARPPQDVKHMNHPVKYVVVWYNTDIAYCTCDEECAKMMIALQERDFSNGDTDIKYNFVIGGNGKAYEGRGWAYQPSEKLPYPRYHGSRVDIAYIGNYRGKNKLPFHMLDAQLNLVSYGRDKDLIVKNYTMIEEEQKFL